MRAPKCPFCGKEHWKTQPCSVAVTNSRGERKRRAITVREVRAVGGEPTDILKATLGKPREFKVPKRGPRAEAAKLLSIANAIISAGPVKRRPGRPRVEDTSKTLTATKPWEALGMSRATWYNRRREGKAK